MLYIVLACAQPLRSGEDESLKLSRVWKSGAGYPLGYRFIIWENYLYMDWGDHKKYWALLGFWADEGTPKELWGNYTNNLGSP